MKKNISKFLDHYYPSIFGKRISMVPGKWHIIRVILFVGILLVTYYNPTNSLFIKTHHETILSVAFKAFMLSIIIKMIPGMKSDEDLMSRLRIETMAQALLIGLGILIFSDPLNLLFGNEVVPVSSNKLLGTLIAVFYAAFWIKLLIIVVDGNRHELSEE